MLLSQAATHRLSESRRDPRFYFLIAGIALGLLGLVIFLVVPGSEVVRYVLMALVLAYVVSWVGILFGKPHLNS